MGRSARARALAGAFAVLLLACAALAASPTPADAPPRLPPGGPSSDHRQRGAEGSIRSFFRRLDVDGDGQIQRDELSAYVGDSVGGKDFDTEGEIRAAVAG